MQPHQCSPMHTGSPLQVASIFGRTANSNGLAATAMRALTAVQTMAATSIAHRVTKCKATMKTIASQRAGGGPVVVSHARANKPKLQVRKPAINRPYFPLPCLMND